ncbi:SRPBCC family protein [Pseudoalteromonas luteoviolacea]|uniref:SRPBCC family protein n=1 Tax=Pseudoalteromonas luteoviolacea TaxID=43657 RepID=UPI001B36FB4C|nr:SRPBCC family protein [Pseudoalteromonas luteoviolacea]MBQ4875726.1 SRPBCC family protein [Pseudoalteromonas luteoviolacea]MBQ4904761.1 SRPBCC family protein [Pseudoalteromonas luteoviolacea]
MKVTKKIIINKSAEQVWHLIAHEFDKAHLWMGPIPNSVAMGRGNSKTGAPMEGRICDLNADPNGAKVKEVITDFNEQKKQLAFDVLPVNNPKVVPIKQNHVSMTVRALGPNQAEVIWVASPELKLFAYPFYPLLRLVFPVAFGKLLKGLKAYAESHVLKANTAQA